MDWNDNVDLSRITNSREQGDIGVAAAHLYYVKNGYSVYFPTTESTPYDLLAVRGGDVLKVQCKTSTSRSSDVSFSVGVATSGGNRSWDKAKKFLTRKSCDVVFVWCGNDSIWEIPVEYASHKQSIVVGPKTMKYHVGGPVPTTKPLSDNAIRKGGVPKVCGAENCDAEIHYTSTYCRSHANALRDNKPRRKEVISWPDDSKLLSMVRSSNFVQVGKRLGVSDNAVRKRLKSHGHDLSEFRRGGL